MYYSIVNTKAFSEVSILYSKNSESNDFQSNENP